MGLRRLRYRLLDRAFGSTALNRLRDVRERTLCSLRRVLAAVVAAAAILGMAAQAGWSDGLQVVPFPGTPDASPSTEIIFSTLAPSQIRWVSVVGSRSGAHAGHLTALPAGGGTAFAPRTRFTPGELVKVRAGLSSSRSGMSFSFTVGRPPAARAGAPASDARPGPPSPRASPGGTVSFRSAPNLHPPALNLTGNPDRSSGDIFLSPVFLALGQNAPVGPLILDSQGNVVWFHPLAHGEAHNLQVQRYQGRPVLTWWHGHLNSTHGTIFGDGRDVLMDSSYRTVATVHAGNGYMADLHEFQLTPRGTALLDAYVPVRADLSSLGGPGNGTVLDCVVQEVDIRTGKVLWEWHSLGHVPLSASHIPVPQTPNVWFDYFHINSIQQLPNGNMIISSRSTWSIYEISHRTGKVLWTLGGKRSSFHMGPGTNFEWQHDARMHSGGLLSLFDDASLPQEETEASAKILKVDTNNMTARLVRRDTHTPPVLAGLAGNAQVLPNGNVFVGWGGAPFFSEYNRQGRQIFSGGFDSGVLSYRALRFPWTGHPLTRPALATLPGTSGALKLYASWNGATQVARWRVLAGQGPGSLHALGPGKRRTSFETAIGISSQARYLAVQALDAHGRVLATSRAHATPAHVAVFGSRLFVSAGQGRTALPVGCFRRSRCRLSATVTLGGSEVGRSGARAVSPDRGALLSVRLSSAAISRLRRAPHGRLDVHVTVRDSSGRRATAPMTLIAYAARGSGPRLTASQRPTIQVLGNEGFVSSHGRGGIVSACYDDVPCRLRSTVSAQGRVIARGPLQRLGVNELGEVAFRLTRAGQRLLAHAAGNHLSARVTLSDGRVSATSRIALIRYR